jgi:hypothetical protein
VRTFAIVVSGALTVIAALPYIWAILRDQASPRLASWAVWTAAQVVGTVAAVKAGQYPAACYVAACGAGCAAVVVLGWRAGGRDFGRLDAVCAILASAGVVLLAAAALLPQIVPLSLAVVVSVVTDFLAFVPTFAHGWRSPREEPWPVYTLYGAGALLALAVTLAPGAAPALTGVIYPAYLLAADTAMVTLILASPHRKDILPAGPG